MKRMFGFTSFELFALVAVVSALGAALWMNTMKDMEAAERMEMKMDARFVSADCGALAKRPARK